MFAQLRHTSRDALDSINRVVPLVSRLLFFRGPSAIHRPSILNTFRTFPAGVMAVLIVWESIYFHSYRGFSPIRQKAIERAQSVANLYSAATVIVKAFCVWVCASLNHRRPNLVRAGFVPNRSMSVRSICRGCNFGLGASARLGLSRCKRGIHHFFFCPAEFAQAKTISNCDSWIPSSAWRFFKNFPASKGLTDDGYFRRHCIGFLFALFSGGCPAVTGTRYDYAKTLN